MTWIIVVLFANIQGDVYMFTNPTFDTQQQCYEYITNRDNIPSLVDKLVQEYQKPMKIRAVNCLEAETIKQILNQETEA